MYSFPDLEPVCCSMSSSVRTSNISLFKLLISMYKGLLPIVHFIDMCWVPIACCMLCIAWWTKSMSWQFSREDKQELSDHRRHVHVNKEWVAAQGCPSAPGGSPFWEWQQSWDVVVTSHDHKGEEGKCFGLSEEHVQWPCGWGRDRRGKWCKRRLREPCWAWSHRNGFDFTSYVTQRRQWHPTAVLLPGKSHGWRSLVGYTIHGVAKSQTRLSDFTFTFHFHALEKEMETHTSVLSWRIPGTGEPDGLPSMGSHRVGHDWSDLAAYVTGVGDDPQQRRQMTRFLSSKSLLICSREWIGAEE